MTRKEVEKISAVIDGCKEAQRIYENLNGSPITLDEIETAIKSLDVSDKYAINHVMIMIEDYKSYFYAVNLKRVMCDLL